jgi:dTDP-4-amino-4,6-dideoxygalactose transaminase
MDWKIPLSDIDLGQDEIDAVVNVLKSKWLTMGAVTQQFEKEFAEYLGVKHAFAVSNGTAALHIACQVLGIGSDDEVIVPSLTFVATANSVLYTGATPIFADITEVDNLNISPDSILEKITPKTKAITVVHYGGYPCDMSRIMQVAREYNLYVIEDAAHAPGAECNGKKCGTIGDVGCFSFFSNKNMTCGEGGMIVTNDDTLADKIRTIRSHGMTSLTWDRHRGHAYSYDVVDIGYNYRIDEIRSALGIVQLSKLEKNNQRRREIAEKYVELLKDTEHISIPFSNYEGKPSFHIFPILLSEGINRYDFIQELRESGIQTSIHYPPIHLFTYYRERFGYKEGILPKTEYVGKHEVTLPLHPLMTDTDVEYIANKINENLTS